MLEGRPEELPGPALAIRRQPVSLQRCRRRLPLRQIRRLVLGMRPRRTAREASEFRSGRSLRNLNGAVEQRRIGYPSIPVGALEEEWVAPAESRTQSTCLFLLSPPGGPAPSFKQLPKTLPSDGCLSSTRLSWVPKLLWCPFFGPEI